MMIRVERVFGNEYWRVMVESEEWLRDCLCWGIDALGSCVPPIPLLVFVLIRIDMDLVYQCSVKGEPNKIPLPPLPGCYGLDRQDHSRSGPQKIVLRSCNWHWKLSNHCEFLKISNSNSMIIYPIVDQYETPYKRSCTITLIGLQKRTGLGDKLYNLNLWHKLRITKDVQQQQKGYRSSSTVQCVQQHADENKVFLVFRLGPTLSCLVTEKR